MVDDSKDTEQDANSNDAESMPLLLLNSSTPASSSSSSTDCSSVVLAKENSKKRTAASTDVFSRTSSSSSQGRGFLTGWTQCPLCPTDSSKLYALGRGVSSHLHAVHTPWKNSKTKQLALIWEPTPVEVEEWSNRVLELTRLVEQERHESNKKRIRRTLAPGYNRSGQRAQSYQSSLPPFLKAAAHGDMIQMQALILKENNVLTLLETRDRNGSTAEHWAAGGGHLSCLKYLIALRQDLTRSTTDDYNNIAKKMRKRDGKTALHYAARNGHNPCIAYLISDNGMNVDEASGDGTTPLHMACYGGHFSTVKLLVEQYKAQVEKVNDWNCGPAHWIAMSIQSDHDLIVKICNYLLLRHDVKFHMPQKQGHTALHKAALRNNKVVIEWLANKHFPNTLTEQNYWGANLTSEEKEEAGKEDLGGNRPSDIWCKVGGDEEFGEWMRFECQW